MLKSLADRFYSSAIQRHLLFLSITFFTIAFVGYHFGTFDQVSHIPFLKKYADPSLFPGDKFFDIRFQMYSYFWFFFQPFYRLGILELAMFIAHVLATYLTFWALWTLSDKLFQNPVSCLLSLSAFMIPHLGFAGFPVFEFSLLNRTFVLPFLLWAIILYLQRHYWRALLLLGLMYNLHVISVNFTLAMILFASLRDIRTMGWRTLLIGMLLFAIGALPVLVWRMTSSPVALRPDPQWFPIISRSMLSNLFYLIAPYIHIIIITASGTCTLVLFHIARRSAPSRQHDGTVVSFIYAVLIILLVQVITAQWYPVTIIVQSQIIRAGLFALIFGYLCFANYLAEIYQSGAACKFDFGILMSSVVVSPLPIIPVIIWGLQRLISSVHWRRAVTASALVSMVIGSIVLAVHLNLWYPGIYVFARKTAWYDTQIWARDNTPKDAVFVTPPQIWWFYEPEWRVFSERSPVVSLSELLVGAFVPDYVNSWKPRFEALAPGALVRFRGDIFENLDITKRAFYSLSSGDLLRIAHQYGATYLVVEKTHSHDWPAVYENDTFIIYKLPSNK